MTKALKYVARKFSKDQVLYPRKYSKESTRKGKCAFIDAYFVFSFLLKSLTVHAKFPSHKSAGNVRA